MPSVNDIRGPKGKGAIIGDPPPESPGVEAKGTIILLPGNLPEPPREPQLPIVRFRFSQDMIEPTKPPVTLEYAQVAVLDNLAQSLGTDRSTLLRLGADLVIALVDDEPVVQSEEDATRLAQELRAFADSLRQRAARRREIRQKKTELGRFNPS